MLKHSFELFHDHGALDASSLAHLIHLVHLATAASGAEQRWPWYTRSPNVSGRWAITDFIPQSETDDSRPAEVAANADIRIHKALPCYDTAVSYSPGVVLIDDRCIVEPLLDHALWDID